MRMLVLLISVFLFATRGFAQSSSHHVKATMISEIISNIRKPVPTTPVVVAVDLTYSELLCSSGVAGVMVLLDDANAIDTVELRILKQIWKDQSTTDSVNIVPFGRHQPLVCQRTIDSIFSLRGGDKMKKFLYVQADCPSDGWNKLEFLLQDLAFSDGDTVFMRHLSSKIDVPVHIYYCENGNVKNMSDEMFVFDISAHQGAVTPKVIRRVKL